jgi:hypothetical protein
MSVTDVHTFLSVLRKKDKCVRKELWPHKQIIIRRPLPRFHLKRHQFSAIQIELKAAQFGPHHQRMDPINQLFGAAGDGALNPLNCTSNSGDLVHRPRIDST